MIYLEKFIFPDIDNDNISGECRRGSFYDEHAYPFHLTSSIGLWSLDFEPITILYGGNGSGKSTIINVISEKLCANRLSMFNSSPYFQEYVERCQYRSSRSLAGETFYNGYREPQKYDISKITSVLTSDDIFHLMQQTRLENDKKLQKSYFLAQDYRLLNGENGSQYLPKHLNLETDYNVDKFSEGVHMRKAKSFNKYLLSTIGEMERCFSNGETALMKLSEIMEAPGLYLLDEPENSMSCEFQIKLASLIQYLASRGNCQFIISTHSPFILSMPNSKIYNLDHNPVDVCNWWELDNMKLYFDLFDKSRNHFVQHSSSNDDK